MLIATGVDTFAIPNRFCSVTSIISQHKIYFICVFLCLLLYTRNRLPNLENGGENQIGPAEDWQNP